MHSKKDEKRGRCSVCQGDYFVMFCPGFKGKTLAERKSHIEAAGHCLNCLGRHKLTECESKKTCLVCSAKHHSTLHDAFSVGGTAVASYVARHSVDPPGAVFLATARVNIADQFSVVHTARALIDQGSESSFVSEALAAQVTSCFDLGDGIRRWG